MKAFLALCRFKEDALPPWTAISTSIGIFVIAFLVGHMLHASMNRIDKVEENCRIFQELKMRADDAVIAKSQVFFSLALDFFFNSLLELSLWDYTDNIFLDMPNQNLHRYQKAFKIITI